MSNHARVEQYIRLIREAHTDNVWLYQHGLCYELYRQLKFVFPQAELWYQAVPGHVLTRIGGRFYDIEGVRRPSRKYLRRVTARELGNPRRWKNISFQFLDQLWHACSKSEEAMELLTKAALKRTAVKKASTHVVRRRYALKTRR